MSHSYGYRDCFLLKFELWTRFSSLHHNMIFEFLFLISLCFKLWEGLIGGLVIVDGLSLLAKVNNLVRCRDRYEGSPNRRFLI